MSCGFLALALGALAPAGAAPRDAGSSERRCGWYGNPTPGNAFLVDADGTWAISSQMQANGPNAHGLDRLSALDDAERTRVGHGSHGDACVCLQARLRPSDMRIVDIESVTPLPLRTCRADAALPPPPSGS